MDVHGPHTTNSWVVPVIGGRIPEILVSYKKTDALKTTLFKLDEKRTPTLRFSFSAVPRSLFKSQIIIIIRDFIPGI